MEFFDICDSDGNLTGKKKLRADVHRDGDWHRTVHIWVLNAKNQILFQKRALTKDSRPGLWDISCAGHIDSGESVVDAALRELHEELALTLRENDLQPLFVVKQSYKNSDLSFIDNEICQVYVVKRPVGLHEIIFQKSEIDELKFISLEEFEQAIISNDISFVQHAEEYHKMVEWFRTVQMFNR